jgi:hypothetical protein
MKSAVRLFDEGLDGAQATKRREERGGLLAVFGNQRLAQEAGAVGLCGEGVEFLPVLALLGFDQAAPENLDAFLDARLSIAAGVDLRFDSIERFVVTGFERCEALAFEVDLKVLLHQEPAAFVGNARIELGRRRGERCVVGFRVHGSHCSEPCATSANFRRFPIAFS